MQNFMPRRKKQSHPITSNGLDFLRNFSGDLSYNGNIQIAVKDEKGFKPICDSVLFKNPICNNLCGCIFAVPELGILLECNFDVIRCPQCNCDTNYQKKHKNHHLDKSKNHFPSAI